MKRLPYWASDAIKCFLIVAVGLLVIWLLFSVGSLFGPDKGSWRKVNIDWDFGLIKANDDDTDIEYYSGFDGLYTKDLIKCSGFEISLSVPAGCTLKVFSFDENDVLNDIRVIDTERFVRILPGDSFFADCEGGIRLCLEPDNGDDFELGLGLGNVMKKWKYSGYVKLSVTNGDTGVKTPDGV